MNKHLLKFIAVQIAIGAALGTLIWICFPTAIWWSYFSGAVIWTFLSCFTSTGDMFCIYLAGGYALVLENPFQTGQFRKRHLPQKGMSIEEVMKIRNPFSQLRVVYGPALIFKLPWERRYKKNAINLGGLAKVSGSIETITQDNVPVTVSFLIILSVIKADECIITLINQGVEKAKDFFQQSAENFFEVAVKNITVEDLFAQISTDNNRAEGDGQKKIKEGFRLLWGGKGIIHPSEWDYALYSNEPTCKFTIDPDYQRAMKLKQTMTKVNEAIASLNQGGVKVPENVALNYIAANQKLAAPVNVSDNNNNINVTGVGNAKHIHIITGTGIPQK